MRKKIFLIPSVVTATAVVSAITITNYSQEKSATTLDQKFNEESYNLNDQIITSYSVEVASLPTQMYLSSEVVLNDFNTVNELASVSFGDIVLSYSSDLKKIYEATIIKDNKTEVINLVYNLSDLAYLESMLQNVEINLKSTKLTFFVKDLEFLKQNLSYKKFNFNYSLPTSIAPVQVEITNEINDDTKKLDLNVTFSYKEKLLVKKTSILFQNSINEERLNNISDTFEKSVNSVPFVVDLAYLKQFDFDLPEDIQFYGDINMLNYDSDSESIFSGYIGFSENAKKKVTFGFKLSTYSIVEHMIGNTSLYVRPEIIKQWPYPVSLSADDLIINQGGHEFEMPKGLKIASIKLKNPQADHNLAWVSVNFEYYGYQFYKSFNFNYDENQISNLYNKISDQYSTTVSKFSSELPDDKALLNLLKLSSNDLNLVSMSNIELLDDSNPTKRIYQANVYVGSNQQLVKRVTFYYLLLGVNDLSSLEDVYFKRVDILPIENDITFAEFQLDFGSRFGEFAWTHHRIDNVEIFDHYKVYFAEITSLNYSRRVELVYYDLEQEGFLEYALKNITFKLRDDVASKNDYNHKITIDEIEILDKTQINPVIKNLPYDLTFEIVTNTEPRFLDSTTASLYLTIYHQKSAIPYIVEINYTKTPNQLATENLPGEFSKIVYLEQTEDPTSEILKSFSPLLENAIFGKIEFHSSSTIYNQPESKLTYAADVRIGQSSLQSRKINFTFRIVQFEKFLNDWMNQHHFGIKDGFNNTSYSWELARNFNFKNVKALDQNNDIDIRFPQGLSISATLAPPINSDATESTANLVINYFPSQYEGAKLLTRTASFKFNFAKSQNQAKLDDISSVDPLIMKVVELPQYSELSVTQVAQLFKDDIRLTNATVNSVNNFVKSGTHLLQFDAEIKIGQTAFKTITIKFEVDSKQKYVEELKLEIKDLTASLSQEFMMRESGQLYPQDVLLFKNGQRFTLANNITIINAKISPENQIQWNIDVTFKYIPDEDKSISVTYQKQFYFYIFRPSK